MDDERKSSLAEFTPGRAVSSQPYIRVIYCDPLIDPLKGGVMERKKDVTRQEVWDDPWNTFGELGRNMIGGDR